MIAERLFRPRERRATMRNPVTAWLQDALSFGLETNSGERINEHTATTIAAVWCAIRFIANNVRKIPLITYRELENGGKERAKDHAVYKLLKHKPNDEWTPAQLKAYLQACALLWPAGYAEIRRRGTSRQIVGLYPIHPTRVLRRLDQNGKLVYVVKSDPPLGDAHIPHADMLVVCDANPLDETPSCGASLIRLARQSLGLAMASEKHAAAMFGNGAMPAGVLEYPAKLKEPELNRLREQWHSRYGTAGNAGKTAVLEGGVTFKPVGMPNEVMQFIESRQFSIEEVARWFNVQPSKLHHLLKANFNTLEEQDRASDSDTMLPWYVAWEEEINIKLFTDEERDSGYYVKYQTNALMRANAKDRADYLTKMLVNGVYTVNEVRALDELNPDPAGDVLLAQAQMTPLERLTADPEEMPTEPPPVDEEPPTEPEPEDEIDEDANRNRLSAAFGVVFRDAYGRIVAREIDRIRAAVKRFAPDKAAFERWMSDFYGRKHGEYVRQALAPAYAGASECGITVNGHLSGMVEAYLRDSTAELRKLAESAADPGFWSVLGERLDRWSEDRASLWSARSTRELWNADADSE